MEQFYLNQEDAVLLVIDVQEKLMVAMDYREQLYKNTNLLLIAAEQLGLPVIVTEQYPTGLGRTVPELTLPEGHKLLEKTTFDAVRAGLLEELEKTGRHTVLVCGTEAHVCIYQTVRGLLGHGYRVFPVQDAICSRFTPNYKSGLKLLGEMGATVITAEGAAFDLLKKAGGPGFKVISKALK